MSDSADESAIKKRVHERDGYCCCICGLKASKDEKLLLQAAHVWPKGKPDYGSYEEDNLLSMCPNCHWLFDKMWAFYIDENSGELVWLGEVKGLDVNEYSKHYDGVKILEHIAKGNLQYKRDLVIAKNR